MAYLLFHNFHFHRCHLVAQEALGAGVAVMAEVPPLLLEVRWFLCASSMSVDSLLYHFGMKGSCPFDFDKSLPGIFLSQPTPSCARETQQPASSLPGLQREVS